MSPKEVLRVLTLLLRDSVKAPKGKTRLKTDGPVFPACPSVYPQSLLHNLGATLFLSGQVTFTLSFRVEEKHLLVDFYCTDQFGRFCGAVGGRRAKYGVAEHKNLHLQGQHPHTQCNELLLSI